MQLCAPMLFSRLLTAMEPMEKGIEIKQLATLNEKPE
jgi:hypothetical protein